VGAEYLFNISKWETAMKTLGKHLVLILIAAAIGSTAFSADNPPAVNSPKQDTDSAKNTKPPFKISKETTYLVEPLRADGYVDYVSALNESCRQGVTPENNALVLLLQAVGPRDIDATDREAFFKMLGIEPLPEKGDYLISFDEYLKQINSNKSKELIDQLDAAVEHPWSEKQYPLVAGWLKANQKPLEKIREAVKRPKFYSPVFSSGKSMLVYAVDFYVQQMSRNCGKYLIAQAMFDIQQGKMVEAQANILACHRLARLQARGPNLIDNITSIYIDGLACSGDVAFAQSGNLGTLDAEHFQTELLRLPPLPKLEDKIDSVERYIFLDCVAVFTRDGLKSLIHFASIENQKIEDDPSFSGDKLKSAFETMIDWDSVLKMGNSWYDRIVEAYRKPTRTERREALKKIDEEIKEMEPYTKSVKSLVQDLISGQSTRVLISQKMANIFKRLFTPVLILAAQSEERGYVKFDLSQLALALGAYRSDRGRYPNGIQELAPKYIAALPKDRFSDADYIYKIEGSGYLLYSVGPNGKDDGGRQSDEEPPGDDVAIRTPKDKK
jgi:hypothetical protein